MRGNQFQHDEDRRVWRQTHCRQILASKVQLDGFLQVASNLVQRWPLGDDWNLDAFADVTGLLPSHAFRSRFSVTPYLSFFSFNASDIPARIPLVNAAKRSPNWRAASTPAIAPSLMLAPMRADRSRAVCATT